MSKVVQDGTELELGRNTMIWVSRISRTRIEPQSTLLRQAGTVPKEKGFRSIKKNLGKSNKC